MQGIATFAAAIAAIAGAWHVAFALGLGGGNGSVTIPVTADGTPVFTPKPWMTLAVAALLGLFAGVVVATAWADDEPGLVRLMVWTAAGILALRVIGDRRYVGLTKKLRGTKFSHLDDRVFTPIVTVLVLGALASLAA